MGLIEDALKKRLADAEEKALMFLRSCGYQTTAMLRGYVRWILDTAYSGRPLVETREARRTHLRGSGTSRKYARAALINARMILVEQPGQFRRGRGTRVRVTPLFSRVSGA